MNTFNFASANAQNCASPITTPVSVVGEYAVDKDGFPIEGAQAPVYLKKNLPIALEFSHKVPFLTYPSMNDFFEIADVWEGSTVFAGRSTLRNLARCFLFPADDYYCREFTIDAGYLRGKLLLQRHMEDISDQKEGYGAVFERTVTAGAHPEANSYNQFVTYSVGEHNLMVRCDVDCVTDLKSKRPLGLTTKKVKRMKKGTGYYPMGPPSYFQEQWLQMVLSGTYMLIIGERDEGAVNTDRANIVKLSTHSAATLATLGGLSSARQQEVFDGLNAALSWIKQCFEQTMASKREAADALSQAQIRFTIAGGRKQLVFVPVAKTQHVEMLSENVVQGINVLAT